MIERSRCWALVFPVSSGKYNLKIAAPDNSPVRRLLLGANIPIAQPLVNIEKLTKIVFIMWDCHFGLSNRKPVLSERLLWKKNKGNIMISLKGHRIVDLSWELVSRVTRMDQTVGRRQTGCL